MTRSRIFYPRLAQALPAKDPLAKLAARALVLYSDLLFEWPGIVDEEGFDGLAKLGLLHRQLYFFRASCVTLQSCRHLLDQLMKSTSFRDLLTSNTTARTNFIDAKTKFDSHRKLIDRLRNEVGGHAEEDLGNAIDRFGPDDVAPIEIHNEDALRPHLATKILFYAIIKDCPRGEEDAEFRKIVNDIHDATKAMLKALTEFLGMYGKRYPLFPE